MKLAGQLSNSVNNSSSLKCETIDSIGVRKYIKIEVALFPFSICAWRRKELISMRGNWCMRFFFFFLICMVWHFEILCRRSKWEARGRQNQVNKLQGLKNQLWSQQEDNKKEKAKITSTTNQGNYTVATWSQEPARWERLGAGGEGDSRGWDGWMVSLTQQMWVWASSGRWWWTGKPGVLQSMESQRVGCDWATERQQWVKWHFGKILLPFQFNFE